MGHKLIVLLCRNNVINISSLCCAPFQFPSLHWDHTWVLTALSLFEKASDWHTVFLFALNSHRERRRRQWRGTMPHTSRRCVRPCLPASRSWTDRRLETEPELYVWLHSKHIHTQERFFFLTGMLFTLKLDCSQAQLCAGLCTHKEAGSNSLCWRVCLRVCV